MLSPLDPPNGWASAARHQQERQWLKLTLNWRSWAGRLQSALAQAPFPHRRKWHTTVAYGQFA